MTSSETSSVSVTSDAAPKVVFVTGLAAEPATGCRTRAFHTIRALCDLGCRVHNAQLIQKKIATPRLDALARSCQRFTHSSTVEVNFKDRGVFWLSDLWSTKALRAGLHCAESLAASGAGWLIVADLSDVLFDDATAKGMLDKTQLEEVKALESGLLRVADVCVWVSEKEKNRAIELYGVDPEKTRVIASFHECPPHGTIAGFAGRRAAVCLAGSTHPHNKRAIEFGVTQLWPRIAAITTGAELHVFGSETEQVIIQPPSQDSCWSRVRVVGEVPSFIGTLSEYRVHMVPVVSGVGVKTKVFDSLVAGTPIVATPAALEGTILEPCDAVFVSDSASALARRAQELLTDQSAWNRAHVQALELSTAVSDFPRFRDTVRAVLLAPRQAVPHAPVREDEALRRAPAIRTSPLATPIFVGTHHKTGTVLAKKVFKRIAEKHGLRFLDVSGGMPVEGQWDIFFDQHSRFDVGSLGLPLRGVHLVRDPRMMVVSGAFYHMHSSEKWLHLPRREFGGLSYQQMIRSLRTDSERFLLEMDCSAVAIREMMEWVARGYSWCMNVRLEDLMTDDGMETYAKMFRHLGFDGDMLTDALDVAYRESVFNPSHTGSRHIRSREVETWRKYFDEPLHAAFREKFGDACERLGYT
jgi:hypothetical protein